MTNIFKYSNISDPNIYLDIRSYQNPYECHTLFQTMRLNTNVYCRIDQIEDELIHEKLKIKAVSDDVDGTFKQMETGEVGR